MTEKKIPSITIDETNQKTFEEEFQEFIEEFEGSHMDSRTECEIKARVEYLNTKYDKNIEVHFPTGNENHIRVALNEQRYIIEQNGYCHTVIDTIDNKPLITLEFKENEFWKYANFHKLIDKLNELAEENLHLKIENVDLTLKNKQWEIFSEQSSYPFGSLLYLQAAAIPFKDIYFIEKEDSSKITIYVKPEYNKKEIKKFTEEHVPLGIDYEIFSIKEIRGDITVIK